MLSLTTFYSSRKAYALKLNYTTSVFFNEWTQQRSKQRSRREAFNGICLLNYIMKAISSVTSEQSRRSRVSSPNPVETIASRSLALMISLTWLTGHQYTCSQSFQQIPQSPWDDGSNPLPTLFLFTSCCLSLCAVLLKKSTVRSSEFFFKRETLLPHMCCSESKYFHLFGATVIADVCMHRSAHFIYLFLEINNKILNLWIFFCLLSL